METAPQGVATPREPMTKDVVTKDDGRKLIYYRFGASAPEPKTPEGDAQA